LCGLRRIVQADATHATGSNGLQLLVRGRQPGRLIPAGTGFWWYRHVQIPADEPPPPPPVQQPSDEDMELDREMEYLVEPEEAEARGITEVE